MISPLGKFYEVLKIMKRVTCHHRIHHSKRWTAEHGQIFTLGNLTSWCWERTRTGGSNNDFFIVQLHTMSLRKIKGKAPAVEKKPS